MRWNGKCDSAASTERLNCVILLVKVSVYEYRERQKNPHPYQLINN